MDEPIELRIDVSEAVPPDVRENAPSDIAASLFIPPAACERRPGTLLVCLPGGFYDRRYYDMKIAGHSGYSMARHLAAKGHLVLTCDPPAIGGSARVAHVNAMDDQVVAAACDSMVRSVSRQLAEGTLACSLPAIPPPRVIGVGHSMGAMLTVVQQARHRTYERLALLGYTAIGVSINDGGDPRERTEITTESIDGGTYRRLRRELFRSFFHWGDVPEAVIRADEQAAVAVPTQLVLAAVAPGAIDREAAQVDVPVFFALGSIDSSPVPRQEVSHFRHCADFTLFLLPRSGHCHNFASTREILWDRIDQWIPARQPAAADPGPATGLPRTALKLVSARAHHGRRGGSA